MAKVRMKTSELEDGMVVAEDVRVISGSLLARKGSKINKYLIKMLDRYGIRSIYIRQEEQEESINPVDVNTQDNDNLLDNTRENIDLDMSEEEDVSLSETIKRSPEFKSYVETFNKTLKDYKNSIGNIVNNNKEINKEELLGQVNSVLSKIQDDLQLFDMFNNLRESDDVIYEHSLNVSLVANMLARWLKFSKEDIELITMAGVLHDIGKTQVPLEILNKKGKLTPHEFNIVKKHTILGYNILKEKNIDQRIKTTALMHHERCDGKGYPMGATTFQIPDFAKIIAIADVYEAMTAVRSYRDKICPFEVIQLFQDEGYQKYDTHYLLTFLSNIVETYLHYKVLLNNGQVGEIVFINKSSPSRPIIKLGGRFVDLTITPTLTIKSIL